MSKFNSELIEYAKASGAFEYAVKRYLANKSDANLRAEVDSTFNYLENVAFKIIVDIYEQSPNDAEAMSVYEIASNDMSLMRLIFNNL